MKKTGDISDKPFPTHAVAAPAVSELTRVCASEKWVSELMAIADDRAFQVSATEHVRFFGRVTVVSSISMGRVLLAVKARLPGEFLDFLHDVDFAERTAQRYMAFARHAGAILENKSMQQIGVERLAVLATLPDDEFDAVAKKGEVGGLTLEQFGALPPSQARKVVAERDRLKKKVDDLEGQIATGAEQLAETNARIRELESGGAVEMIESDAAYVAEVDKLRASVKRLIAWFHEHPPQTGRQMREVFNFSFFESDILETFVYDLGFKGKLPPDVRAGLERAMEHRFDDVDAEMDAALVRPEDTIAGNALRITKHGG